MTKKQTVRARLFYGELDNFDSTTKNNPTSALIRFYAEDKKTDEHWFDLYKSEGYPHPERFLIKHGFKPVGDTLYELNPQQ